jgi:hypothetical protein
MHRICAMAMAVIGLLAQAVAAQTVDQQSKDWTVFTHDATCYIGSIPKKGAGDGKAYVLVTHRSAMVDEVSIAVGATYKPNEPVQVLVGKNRFKLFAQDNLAWARDQKTDAAMVGSFKKNATLSVKATDDAGHAVMQSYSLSGFGAAYKRMKALCK